LIPSSFKKVNPAKSGYPAAIIHFPAITGHSKFVKENHRTMSENLTTLLLLPILILLPVLVARMEKRSRIIRWLSPMVICYLIGIGLGNIPGISYNNGILENIWGISVFLAIPLLLFSANFFRMLKQVRPALFAFFLGIFGVIASAVVAFLVFGDRLSHPEAVSGMMIGVYTGGTPNMSAIGVALGVDEEVFVLLNSADIVFSGIYFIFLLTAGKRVLNLFLPNFRKKWDNHNPDGVMDQASADPGRNVRHVITGAILAVLVLAMGLGLSYIIRGKISFPLVILGITTLAIGASFHPRIQHLPHTFSSANYLLLVFALTMGSMANFSELVAASSTLFYFCGFVVFGSVVLHYLLAFIFRIDRDTVIIASTAAIFGPAFIGPVANVIGNKDIIAMGITLGLIGYAIGNYLGLGLAFILK
jgi:uncharacterized membrane protein